MARKVKIKEGDKYGRLTIIKELPTINYRRKVLCRCDCGTVKEYFLQRVIHGETKSCGCLSKELFIERSKHFPKEVGKSRLHTIWFGMKCRCYTQSASNYNRYGGKGIVVCDEWKNDFLAFYNWAINNGYSDNLTIDRINYTGNYEPSNCRWIPAKEQAANRSNVQLIPFNGETHTIPEWSEITGINYKCLYARILAGWSIEDAFNKPIRQKIIKHE